MSVQCLVNYAEKCVLVVCGCSVIQIIFRDWNYKLVFGLALCCSFTEKDDDFGEGPCLCRFCSQCLPNQD